MLCEGKEREVSKRFGGLSEASGWTYGAAVEVELHKEANEFVRNARR